LTSPSVFIKKVSLRTPIKLFSKKDSWENFKADIEFHTVAFIGIKSWSKTLVKTSWQDLKVIVGIADLNGVNVFLPNTSIVLLIKIKPVSI
jgi:hypothetical protein